MISEQIMVEERAMKSMFFRKFGIRFWGQFKDDILLVMAGKDQAKIDRLIRILRMKSSFFKSNIESQSQSGVQMLDIVLFKGVRWRHAQFLDHRAFVKPTTLYSPLCTSSAHPLHVHAAWPRGMIHRLRSLCSNRKIGEMMAEDFLNLYIHVNQCTPTAAKHRGVYPDNTVKSYIVLP